MRPEAELERRILTTIGHLPGVLAMKNEVGQGFTGNLAKRLCRECRDLAFRHRITYGLGVGSPDLLVVVDGIALGGELKSDRGTMSADQERWHSAAAARGMRVGEWRSVEDAVRAVEGARR